MEDEIRKHLSALRTLVTIALLSVVLSFAFSYILFKNVTVPLDQLHIKKINAIEEKIDKLSSGPLKGCLDMELQRAMLNMQKVANISSGELQAQAQKVIVEIKAISDKVQGAKAAK